MERQQVKTQGPVLGTNGHSGKVWDGASCAPQKPGRGLMGALTAQPKAAH